MVEREQLSELGFRGWTEAGSCAKDQEACRQNARPYFPQREKDKTMMMMKKDISANCTRNV